MARVAAAVALVVVLLPGQGSAAARCGGGSLVVQHYSSSTTMDLVPRHGYPRALDRDSFTLISYDGADRPSWSPDGRSIAYGWNQSVIGPALVAGHLRVTRVSDGRHTDDVTIPVAGAVFDVAWSPDGKRFAFTLFTVNTPVAAATWSSLGSHSAVWIYDPAATPTLRPVTKVHTEFDRAPTWNRDGRRLAWISDLGGVPRPVVQDVDAPAALPRALSSGTDFATTVSWSPDGRLVAWTSYPLVSLSYQPATLWVARPDGGAARRLALTAGEAPTWSPDSRRIAYSAIGTDRRWSAIRVLDLRTGRNSVLARAVGFAPAWSPDGREIAYVRTFQEGAALSVVSADGRRGTDLVGPARGQSFGTPVWCR